MRLASKHGDISAFETIKVSRHRLKREDAMRVKSLKEYVSNLVILYFLTSLLEIDRSYYERR